MNRLIDLTQSISSQDITQNIYDIKPVLSIKPSQRQVIKTGTEHAEIILDTVLNRINTDGYLVPYFEIDITKQNGIVIQKNGIYSIEACMNVTGVTQDWLFLIYLYRNGEEIILNDCLGSGSSYESNHSGFMRVNFVELYENDILVIKISSDDLYFTIENDFHRTYLQVQLEKEI